MAVLVVLGVDVRRETWEEVVFDCSTPKKVQELVVFDCFGGWGAKVSWHGETVGALGPRLDMMNE